MRNGTQTQAHDPSQADHNRDNVYNLDEHGDDRRYKHQWLDRLQDADPPRHSILAIAYALTRFAVKTPRKFFGRIQIVADRAHVARSQAKVDLKWMHDNGWLVFGELTTEELQTLKVSDSEDLRVRVITIPAGNSARPPVEPQRTSSPRGGRPVGHGVAAPLATPRPPGWPQSLRVRVPYLRARARTLKEGLQGEIAADSSFRPTGT